MSRLSKKQMTGIVDEITNYYLKSRDFNGLPLSSLRKKYPLTKEGLKSLIGSGNVEAHFGYGHPNPHVKALPLGDIDAQLKMLADAKKEVLEYTVLYPTKSRLAMVIDPSDYADRPFTLLMALGEPSLDYQCFEPQVLKTYRDDPRYYYSFSGVVGRLYVEDEDFPEKDKIYLDCIGTGFSKDYEKDSKSCVVAFPYYLHKLPPEQQMLWKHRQLDKDKYNPEHGYIASQVMGSWDYSTTMYEAFVAELQVINKMAVEMEGEPLFKHDFSDGTEPPRNFHRLLLPTKREYYEFIESLDKLMSDNINRKFFKRKMPASVDDDSKGTIALLEEYFSFLQAKDRKPIEDMLKAFRKVRSLRSKSSHHTLSDKYSDAYNREQQDVMRDAYGAVRLVRLAFTNHADTKTIEVPSWLYKGEISSR